MKSRLQAGSLRKGGILRARTAMCCNCNNLQGLQAGNVKLKI